MGGIKMMEVKAGNARYSRTIAKFSSLPLLLAHLALCPADNAGVNYFGLKLIVYVLIRDSLVR